MCIRDRVGLDQVVRHAARFSRRRAAGFDHRLHEAAQRLGLHGHARSAQRGPRRGAPRGSREPWKPRSGCIRGDEFGFGFGFGFGFAAAQAAASCRASSSWASRCSTVMPLSAQKFDLVSGLPSKARSSSQRSRRPGSSGGCAGAGRGAAAGATVSASAGPAVRDSCGGRGGRGGCGGCC